MKEAVVEWKQKIREIHSELHKAMRNPIENVDLIADLRRQEMHVVLERHHRELGVLHNYVTMAHRCYYKIPGETPRGAQHGMWTIPTLEQRRTNSTTLFETTPNVAPVSEPRDIQPLTLDRRTLHCECAVKSYWSTKGAQALRLCLPPLARQHQCRPP